MGTVTKGYDARLANRPFLVFDFRALWRSALALRECPEVKKKQKWPVSQHVIEFLNYCSYV